MAIDKKELGHRVKVAREAANMTQDAMASLINLSRPTVSQMESGERAISSLELNRIAYLCGLDIRDFFTPVYKERKDQLSALFRAAADAIPNDSIMKHLRRCVALAREQTELENLLEIDRTLPSAVYAIPHPAKKWDAIKQGERIADEERKRLGIGLAAISNLSELLESEGIRLYCVNLPKDISGFTMFASDLGPIIVVNKDQGEERCRYSYAHEYAHVLMDRHEIGTISRHSQSASLVEVRANVFAASFLMPAEGVKQFMSSLGKQTAARSHKEIFDGQDVVPVEIRQGKATNIHIVDVIHLAHHFNVSRQAALYRLFNLGFISENELRQLQEQEISIGSIITKSLRLPKNIQTTQGDENNRLIALALKALSSKLISEGYFKQTVRLAQRNEDEIDHLLIHARDISTEIGKN